MNAGLPHTAPDIEYRTQTVALLSGDTISRKVDELRRLIALRLSGFDGIEAYCGRNEPDFGQFPLVPSETRLVFRGRAGASYSHHATLARLGDRYAVFWACGQQHEDRPWQTVRGAASADLVHWQAISTPEATAPAGDTVWFVNGACNDGERLVLYAACWRPAIQRISLHAFTTTDLETWEEAGEISQPWCLREGPRRTPTDDLLAAGFSLDTNETCVVLRWPAGISPTAPPQRHPVPASPSGVRPENGSWYALPDGRLMMLLRDGALSLRLGLTISEDGGRTWSPPVLTDFPNTYSRIHCGALGDGRTYILGNNFDHCLDRTRLLLAISDDGVHYERMYTVRQDPPLRRFHGFNKDLGFAYPNALTEPGRLVMAYSANKEDIEVSVVHTTGL